MVLDSPTTFVVVRHGQTVWNAEKRWQGWLDSPLTALGEAQAQAAGAIAVGYGRPSGIYSSDAGRALRTAELVRDVYAPTLDVPIIPTNCLRERFYGYHEALTAAEIDARYPGTRYQKGRDNRETYRPPGGETFAEARERVGLLVEHLMRRHVGETVLLVTHSGVVRIFDSLGHGGISLELSYDRNPPNACVFVLQMWRDGRVKVLRDLNFASTEL